MPDDARADRRVSPRRCVNSRETLTRLLDIRSHINRFIGFGSDHAPVAVALWVAHCYVVESAAMAAYLRVRSAAEESGKSTLLEVLHQLLRTHGINAVSVSPSVVYRLREKVGPGRAAAGRVRQRARQTPGRLRARPARDRERRLPTIGDGVPDRGTQLRAARVQVVRTGRDRRDRLPRADDRVALHPDHPAPGAARHPRAVPGLQGRAVGEPPRRSPRRLGHAGGDRRAPGRLPGLPRRAPGPARRGLVEPVRDRRPRRRGLARGCARRPPARSTSGTTTSPATASACSCSPMSSARSTRPRPTGSPTAKLLDLLASNEEGPWGKWWGAELNRDGPPSRRRPPTSPAS